MIFINDKCQTINPILATKSSVISTEVEHPYGRLNIYSETFNLHYVLCCKILHIDELIQLS